MGTSPIRSHEVTPSAILFLLAFWIGLGALIYNGTLSSLGKASSGEQSSSRPDASLRWFQYMYLYFHGQATAIGGLLMALFTFYTTYLMCYRGPTGRKKKTALKPPKKPGKQSSANADKDIPAADATNPEQDDGDDVIE